MSEEELQWELKNLDSLKEYIFDELIGEHKNTKDINEAINRYAERYHEMQLKLLGLHNVSQQRELLIAELNKTDLEYIQQQGCTDVLADDLLKAINYTHSCVTNFGKKVFDTKEQFYLWLTTPSYALGNLKPSELLKDSYGKELVMGELNRIDKGIFV